MRRKDGFALLIAGHDQTVQQTAFLIRTIDIRQPEDGYIVLSCNDALHLWQQPVPSVALRSVDTSSIRKTIDMMVCNKTLTNDQAVLWKTRLSVLDEELSARCQECLRLRVAEVANAQVMSYTKERVTRLSELEFKQN